MTHPVTGAPSDVGTGHEARDRSAIRGPSFVREHTAARERIPTFVLDEHEDAMDVFRHPYAYAAHRGLEFSVASGEKELVAA